MPPSGGSSPSSPSSDADSDYELASIESESKSYELHDENETLEELAAANGQQLEFPAGVPAEVIRSVEERLKQLPFETPGCTLPLVYPRADPTSALYLVLAEELQARGDGMQPSHLTTDCIVTIQGHEFVCVQYLLAHAMTPAALNFFQDAACAAMTKEWHAVVFNVHAGGAALAVCPHTPSRAQPHPPCAEPASLHVQPVSMIKATRDANEQDKAVGSPFVGAGSRNWLCRLMDSETGEFKPGELAFLPLVDAVQAMRRAAPRASFRLRVSTASPRASAPPRPPPRLPKLQPVEPAVETPGDEDDDDDHDDDEDVTPYTDGSLCRVQSGRNSRSNYPRYLLVAVSSTKPLRYKAAPGQKEQGWAENRTFRHAQLQLEATSEEVVERAAKAAREEQVKQEAHKKKEMERAAKKERAEKKDEAKRVRDEAKRVREEEASRKVLLTKRRAEEKKHEQEEKQKQRDAEQAEKERLEEAKAAKVKDALMKAAKAAEAAAKAKTAESEREKKELLAAVANANRERLAAEAKAKAERLAAQKAQKEAEAQVAALMAELAKKVHNRTEPDPEEEPEQKRNKSSGRVASPGPSTPPVKARSRRSPSSSASPSSRASVVQRREELAALEDAQLARARVRVQHDEREKDRDRRRRRN